MCNAFCISGIIADQTDDEVIRALSRDAGGLQAALPVSLEEVGEARGLPPDGCVYPVVGNIPTEIDQLHWIALFQVGLPEEPESVSCGGGEGNEARCGDWCIPPPPIIITLDSGKY